MFTARRRVQSTAAWARAPNRHFVIGAAELGKSFFLRYTSFHLDHTSSDTFKMSNTFTRRMTLVNMEDEWGLGSLFRSTVIAPYLPVAELLDADADAEDATSTARPPPARPLLLFFRGSSGGRANMKARTYLLNAILRAAHSSDGRPRVDVVLEGIDKTHGSPHGAATAEREAEAEPRAVTNGSSAKAANTFTHGFVSCRASCRAPTLSYTEAMHRSVFCLTPAGHTCTSRRLFDAVAAGCIPVRVDCLSDHVLPFPHALDPSHYSLTEPASRIAHNPAAFEARLRTLAADQHWLRAMRHNVSLARKLFAYAVGHTHPSSEQPQHELQPQHVNPTKPETFRFGGAIRGVVDELLSAVGGRREDAKERALAQE